ncbi:hypothetical protein PanWU01x14_321190, partial [Parasponia andersonii]
GWSRQGRREDFTGHGLEPGFLGHLLLKVVYVIEGVSFPIERPEGRGREVPRPGLHLDPVGEGRPVDPSHSLLCQIVGGLAVMGPESLTQLRHLLLLPVGRHTSWASMASSAYCPPGLEGSRLALPCPLHPRSGRGGSFLAVDFRILTGPLRQNLISAGSCLRSPATPRGGRYLCVPLRLLPLNQDGFMGHVCLPVCFRQGGKHLIQLLLQIWSCFSGAPFGVGTCSPGCHP